MRLLERSGNPCAGAVYALRGNQKEPNFCGPSAVRYPSPDAPGAITVCPMVLCARAGAWLRGSGDTDTGDASAIPIRRMRSCAPSPQERR